MKLSDLLSEDRVVIPIHAETLLEAARQLLRTFVDTNLALDADMISELLGGGSLPRGGVTVGQQAFILHVRTDAVKKLSAAIGVSPEPIRQEEESRRQARIAVLLMAPHKESSLFLQAVSAFAKLLGQEENVEALLACTTSPELLKVGKFDAVNLPGYLTTRDFMTKQVPSVKGDTTLYRATRIMVTERVPSLPVVSDTGEVLGMVNHRVILSVMLPWYVKRMKSGESKAVRSRLPRELADPRNIPVKEVMDKSVLCISEEHTLADVATMMVNKDVSRFPVVRDGVRVGMLTRDAVVGKLFGP